MSYTEAIQYSADIRNARLQSDETVVGTSPILVIFGGAAKPATCATADAGSALGTLALPSDWQAAPSGGAAAKAGTWEDTAADDTGIARYWRMYESGPGDCHMQGFVSQAWEQSTGYVLNQQVSNDNGVYICTTAGTSSGSGTGPSGTGTGITDGSAVWSYLGAKSLVLQNVSLATGQPIEITSFTRTVGGA
jgi:hypothetical protein